MSKCCFCGKEITGWGNNPWPVITEKDAECCDECNINYVIPARLLKLKRDEEKETMLKGILITPEQVTATEIEDSLETYYDILDCDCIDITSRLIGGKMYDIVCDDEGLLKDMPVPSALSIVDEHNARAELFGKLFICHGNDETGELESLTQSEIDDLLRRVVSIEYTKDEHACCIVLD